MLYKLYIHIALFTLLAMPAAAQNNVQEYALCKAPNRLAITAKMKKPFAEWEKKPFLTIHGNVQYDFMYRSLTDTPFSQKDFTQHSVQAVLDISIRDQYPFRIVISGRRSNSPYFDNITDVNLQFNRFSFMNGLKERLAKKLPNVWNNDRFNELERLFEQKKEEIKRLQLWVNKPDRLQEAIEAKEAAVRCSQGIDDGMAKPSMPSLNTHIPGTEKLNSLADSLLANKGSSLSSKKENIDSTINNTTAKFQQQKEKLDKAIAELKEYETKLMGLKISIQDSTGNLKQQLAQITDPARLKEFIREHKLDDKNLPKGWKTLSAINNIGIGRTWVDYSELTVKNISLTGINIEANPSRFYIAAAAGKVNYRFRDFVIRDNRSAKQSLYLIRAGLGKKDGNNIIFTWYDGKKNLLQNTGFPLPGSLERVIGVSVQTRLQVDENHYVILESAKSSFANTGNITRPIDKVWNFSDRSNEAYSIRIYNHWPKHHTKLNGYYRKMGTHFQSFTLQPINVNQEAYQFGIQQAFLKKKLTVDAGIRKNDFSNPYINPGINSKTVFKSLQLSLRVPKYPFISIGYYPSSQLTVLDNNIIAENQYNTLSAVVSHAWHKKKTAMSTNLVFLKFYNNGADTGFIYYNASSITASHFVFFKNWQWQTGVTFTEQQLLKVFTLEQSLSFTAKEWLTLNGGMKYNRINSGQTLWGGTAGLGIHIKHIGTIQAMYDKSYLPGTSRNLLPVDMGRVTYYRTF